MYIVHTMACSIFIIILHVYTCFMYMYGCVSTYYIVHGVCALSLSSSSSSSSLSQDAHDNEVSALAFNQEGNYMATGGSDKVVKVWSWRPAQGTLRCVGGWELACGCLLSETSVLLFLSQRKWNPSALSMVAMPASCQSSLTST